jgi:hypothetical protein
MEPNGTPSKVDKREAVDLYIGFDDTLDWNGTTAPVEQLDAYITAAARGMARIGFVNSGD